MENKFYTAAEKTKNVSKAEFEKFLAEYPRKLTRNVSGIAEPPAISYNDFELANRWPYSVVARTFAYSDTPGEYYYTPEEERVYTICENYEELFASKTGYQE